MSGLPKSGSKDLGTHQVVQVQGADEPVVLVDDQGRVTGIFTEGDLRRLIERLLQR
jgi:CBS domain-containing protein